MQDLIARLEAATEGSRLLDTDIWNWRCQQRGKPEAMVLMLPDGHFPVTTRIDAMVTLFPKDWLWIIYGNHGDGMVELFPSGDRNSFRKTHGATVPLAGCIAALKASHT